MQTLHKMEWMFGPGKENREMYKIYHFFSELTNDEGYGSWFIRLFAQMGILTKLTSATSL